MGLLGVHREIDAGSCRPCSELPQARQQLRQHTLALRNLVARVQGGKLDRYAGAFDQSGLMARRGDRIQRCRVLLEVAPGIGRGHRSLTQHVVGQAIALLLQRLGAPQRVVDALAHHELLGHDAHRLHQGCPDDRLAAAADETPQDRQRLVARRLPPFHQTPGQHQGPGRRVDQERIAVRESRAPIRLPDLVADQLIRLFPVGDAQQRFRDAHQHHALVGGEPIVA